MWKDIPNFEGLYEISDSGEVRSVTRTIVSTSGRAYTLTGRILKPNKIKNGYMIVHLSSNGRRTAIYIHRAVAQLFVPNPDNLPVINHKNGNKEDCRASNLEWVTYSENNQHAYNTGLKHMGARHYNARLTENDVREIRRRGKDGTFQSIADKYGVSKATIRDILLFRSWKAII